MKFSSHLFLTTEATLRRYPIVDVDPQGQIISIEFHDSPSESAAVSFFSGVLVAGIVSPNLPSFVSREEFCTIVPKFITAPLGLTLISGFPLDTFNAPNPQITQLCQSQ